MANSTIKVNEKIFVFQPETDIEKAHWLETVITSVYEEDGEMIFTVDKDIYLPGSSLGWNEWSHQDCGKGWDYAPTPNSMEEQTQLLLSLFD